MAKLLKCTLLLGLSIRRIKPIEMYIAIGVRDRPGFVLGDRF